MAICPCHANVYAMWAGEGQDDQRIQGPMILQIPSWDTVPGFTGKVEANQKRKEGSVISKTKMQ